MSFCCLECKEGIVYIQRKDNDYIFKCDHCGLEWEIEQHHNDETLLAESNE